MQDVGIQQLTSRSLAKLRKGHPVRINGGAIPLKLHSSRMKPIEKAFGRGKGHQLALSAEEIEANGEGIFGKKFDKFLKKAGIKKAVYKAGDNLKPLAKDAIRTGASALALTNPQLAPLIAPATALATDYLDRPTYYQKNKGRNFKRASINALSDVAKEQARNELNNVLMPVGNGLYAGYGLYAGGDYRGYGVKSMPNVANQALPFQLRSNPYGENFIWGSTLPPEYARLHR
jgi:hypothetical protein